MPTHAAEVKERSRPAESDAPAVMAAVLFELESLAVDGHQITYDVIHKALAEKKINFSPIQFSRHCLHPTLSCYLAEFLAQIAPGAAQQALNDEISTRWFSRMGSDSAALHPGLGKVLDAAAALGIPAGVISALPEELAESLFAKLGLAQQGARLFTFKNVEKNFPRADFWLKVSRSMSRSPRSCIVVANSMAACKSALSAGMRCVVVPDAFTSHQDFGGADVVVDSWDELNAREVLKSFLADQD